MFIKKIKLKISKDVYKFNNYLTSHVVKFNNYVIGLVIRKY